MTKMLPKSQVPQGTPPKRQEQGHVKAMMEAHKESHKIIKNYMLGRDIPDWYRGTSNFQGKAANRLNESLLYDLEQRTSHRVRACLIGLGLNPMIKNDEIKFLIKLSRANDLAFLWFLYELHYKTPSPQYSINEQLILSTISHLDMIPTLRELDRLLPPGVKGSAKTPKKCEKAHVIRPGDVHIHGKVEEVRSPYLNPVRLPKPHNNANTCERKDFRVTLGEYDSWEDPNYVVHNEANRWFADYEPKAGRRVVHNILKEEIANIFDDYEEMQERAQSPNVMCEGHRRIAEMEEKLRVELQIIAREQCQKYFDVESVRKSRAQARIKAQMEKDVEMFLAKFRHCAEKIQPCHTRKNVKASIVVLRGVDSFNYDHIHSSEGLRDNEHFGSFRELDPDAIGDNAMTNYMDGDTKERQRAGQQDSCSDSSDESEHDKKRFSMSCFHLSDCERTPKAQNKNNLNGNGNGKSAVSNNNNNNNKHPNMRTPRCEEDDGEPLPPCSSMVFFKAAQQHQPWRFDYHKIFLTSHPYLETDDVKQQAVRAIDSEMSFQAKVESLAKPNYNKAVGACAKRIWRRSVRVYNEEHPSCHELAAVRFEKETEAEKVPLDFGQDTFDPNDIKLMTHMLKTAFEIIKQNPKFVLASLPEAYKLPSFVYFIQNRYGKRYSLQDRHRLYLESLKILRALEKLTKKIPMPKIKQFCTNPFVSYACRDYLLAKANKIKQDYYEQLDNAIMRQARVFWFAMRPYLCTSGPPRNTYFAYMPSRSVDITRFRQWKSTEFMNAKGAWDRRQREARLRVFK